MGLIDKTLQVFIGSRNERQIKALKREVARINALEAEIEKLDNKELRHKTSEFKHRIESGESLEDIQSEAFAVVREAAKRTLGQRHYDVQMMGGLVLHQGMIAEMVTGEGKTLTSTCPVYLNALSGKGVHVITVNDYLARRDAEWMGNIFRILGLTCGFIQGHMDNAERRQMYACDVTYGTNNEFGFDYLRDNMKQDPREQVQRALHYAVIDEVDSILIDEARTPLIISGPAEDFGQLYLKADDVARKLDGIEEKKLKEKLGKSANDKEVYQKAVAEYDFEFKEKESQVNMTDKGISNVEKYLGITHLYNAENQGWPHMIEQALRAHHLFKKDKNYVVQKGEKGEEIVIVDEFTGRLQHGRRWSDGLHQAIEAKERIDVREESVTYATVTLQNYFKLYEKMAGMTGSAMTEASEFDTIYQLDVIAIPTNRPLIRHDRVDLIYGSEGEKFNAAVAEVVKLHLAGRPILLGTTSVMKSEILSDLLKRVSVRMTDGVLSVRTPVFHLPAPGSGRRGGDGEMIKVEPISRPDECLKVEDGKVFVRLSDPSARMLDTNANVETWFPVREELAEKLKDAGFMGVPHHVLNAKLHAQEAEIVAQAGKSGSVTIATNMAGRGTDIILGGNGDYFTKQYLKREHNMDVAYFMPEEYRGQPSYMIPRDVLLEAEKAFDEKVEETYREKFKPEFSAAHDEVVKLGGLAVVGTERHESRRIDNQLRGRCGRQGDPGSSQFFLSLDDDLMRLFAGERMRNIMRSLGLKEGQEIESGMVSRAVEKAQRKVEGRNFDIRKNLKEYDDVLDVQRKSIYGIRQQILEGVNRIEGTKIDQKVRAYLNDLLVDAEQLDEDQAKQACEWMQKKYKVTWQPEKVAGNKRIVVRENMVMAAKLSLLPKSIIKRVNDTVLNVMNRLSVEAAPEGVPAAQWMLDSFKHEIEQIFAHNVELDDVPTDSEQAFDSYCEELAQSMFDAKRKEIKEAFGESDDNENRIVQYGRFFLLSSLDTKWREHLRNMDQLRYGVRWEAQAQKDPKVAYKREGRSLFEAMRDDIDTDVARRLFHVRLEGNAPTQQPRAVANVPLAEQKAFANTKSIGEQALRVAKAANERVQENRKESGGSEDSAKPAPAVKVEGAPRANDACWCGSGKKYKKCHMNSDRQGLTSPK